LAENIVATIWRLPIEIAAHGNTGIDAVKQMAAPNVVWRIEIVKRAAQET